MAKYSVPMTTWASTTVEIEVPDDMTDPEQIAEIAERQLHADGIPSLCHQCAGGTRYGSQNLEIGDEWEAAETDGKPGVIRLD